MVYVDAGGTDCTQDGSSSYAPSNRSSCSHLDEAGAARSARSTVWRQHQHAAWRPQLR